MAQTPETKVKLSVTKILDEYNVYYFKPATGGYGRSGVPDIVGCFNGKFIAIECKAQGGKATALQLREIDRILNCGGVALLINETNLDTLRDIFEVSCRASSLKGKNDITLA